MNNVYFHKWLGPCFIAGYIISQANAVMNGTLTVGVLVSTIRIYNEISEDFADVYEVFLKVIDALEPMKKLTVLINKGTDIVSRKRLSRLHQEESDKANE